MMDKAFRTFYPEKEGLLGFHKILVSAVAPRPIAFVSTISASGVRNLSPFSYFNVFGANPPIAIFSASTTESGKDKDTLANIRATRECIVHIADRRISHQLSLSSAAFSSEVDEFERSGLTPTPGAHVKPYRVVEANVAFECVVQDIVPLGESRGSGNLAICRILMAHVANDVLDDSHQMVDPRKLRPIGRLGGEWYLETTPSGLFELPRPPTGEAMGIAAVLHCAPAASDLTPEEQATLACVAAPPDGESVDRFYDMWRQVVDTSEMSLDGIRQGLLQATRSALSKQNVAEAWVAVSAASRVKP